MNEMWKNQMGPAPDDYHRDVDAAQQVTRSMIAHYSFLPRYLKAFI
jgi:hypothetical protein